MIITHKHLLLAALGLCLCVSAVNAGVTEAERALAEGDYEAAFAAYEQAARAGDPLAMSRLAALYQRGEGVPADLAKAVELYLTAAQLGDAEAQYSLGNLYLLGEGVPQDDDWAFTYYRLAAEQGHPLARQNVREFYRAAGVLPPPELSDEGTSTAPAPAPAPVIPAPPPGSQATAPAAPPGPAAAATTGYSSDELKAIQMARAHGIELDFTGAAEAPAAGALPGAIPAGAAAPSLDDVKAALAAGRLSDSLPGLEVLASNGSAEAQFLLADTLSTLRRDADEKAAALMWLSRAAESGWPEAQYELGRRYLEGDGVPADDAEAISLFRSAARQGHGAARDRLEAIYNEAGLPAPQPGGGPGET